jgi:phage I-like protein
MTIGENSKMNKKEFDLLAFADVTDLISSVNESGLMQAPEQILILKFGKNRYTQDGNTGEFDFDESDADNIINEFETRGRDLLVDYEHANLIKGKEAPAAGWISKLLKTRDGLLACIKNWTDKAKAYVEAGEYKYQSPVLGFNDKKRPILLHSLGLTNHPALHGPIPLFAGTDSSILPLDGFTFEQTIDVFKNRIVGLKHDLDFLKSDMADRDAIKNDLNREIVAFCDFAGRRGDETKSDAQGFIDMLFLSDLTDSNKQTLNTRKGKSQMNEKDILHLAKMLGLADKSVKPEDSTVIAEDGAVSEELPTSGEIAAEPTADQKAMIEKVAKAVEDLIKMKDMIAEALGVEANLDAIMMKLAELSGRPSATEVAAVQEEVAMTDAKVAVEKALNEKKFAKSLEKWALDFAKRDIKGFKAFTDSLKAGQCEPVPTNVALTDIDKPPAIASAPKYSATEIEVAEQFGNKPEEVYGKR